MSVSLVDGPPVSPPKIHFGQYQKFDSIDPFKRNFDENKQTIVELVKFPYSIELEDKIQITAIRQYFKNKHLFYWRFFNYLKSNYPDANIPYYDVGVGFRTLFKLFTILGIEEKKGLSIIKVEVREIEKITLNYLLKQKVNKIYPSYNFEEFKGILLSYFDLFIRKAGLSISKVEILKEIEELIKIKFPAFVELFKGKGFNSEEDPEIIKYLEENNCPEEDLPKKYEYYEAVEVAVEKKKLSIPNISESWKDCFEILEELISEKLRIELLVPEVVFKKQRKIRTKKIQGDNIIKCSKIKGFERKELYGLKFYFNLRVPYRLVIAGLDKEDRIPGLDIGYCLQNMVDFVEKNEEDIEESSPNFSLFDKKKPIINECMRQQILKEEDEEKKKQDDIIKVKNRVKYLQKVMYRNQYGEEDDPNDLNKTNNKSKKLPNNKEIDYFEEMKIKAMEFKSKNDKNVDSSDNPSDPTVPIKKIKRVKRIKMINKSNKLSKIKETDYFKEMKIKAMEFKSKRELENKEKEEIFRNNQQKKLKEQKEKFMKFNEERIKEYEEQFKIMYSKKKEEEEEMKKRVKKLNSFEKSKNFKTYLRFQEIEDRRVKRQEFIKLAQSNISQSHRDILLRHLLFYNSQLSVLTDTSSSSKPEIRMNEKSVIELMVSYGVTPKMVSLPNMMKEVNFQRRKLKEVGFFNKEELESFVCMVIGDCAHERFNSELVREKDEELKKVLINEAVDQLFGILEKKRKISKAFKLSKLNNNVSFLATKT